MKAYNVKTTIGFNFLIHGWQNKKQDIVHGCYPTGEKDVLHIGSIHNPDLAEIDKVHIQNYKWDPNTYKPVQ